MIDFHSHLVPGVDDGAADLGEARSALEAMRAQGVHTLATTPHLQGSLTKRPTQLADFLGRLDAAWSELRAMAASEFPTLRLERGTEVMLDTPDADLSDDRVRLAGTDFVLVEFPGMAVPPHSVRAIFDLKMKGWTPIVAHPERYSGLGEKLEVVEEWRRVGGLLQLNGGSLLGRYGGAAQATAWRLLRRGWVSYLSSDYHARGRFPMAAARAELVAKGGEDQAGLLLEENPGRLLAGRMPAAVPPLQKKSRSFWRRIFVPTSR